MDEQKLLELGKAVNQILQRPGEWPKVLTFDLYDHKRRMEIADVHDRVKWSEPLKEDCVIAQVVIPGGWQQEG